MKTSSSRIFLTFLLFCSSLSSVWAQVRFSDISASVKVQGMLRNGAYVYGHGVAVADINLDGLPDIYLANAAEGIRAYPEQLYISHAGKAFTEEASGRGVLDSYGIGSHGVVFFDMDNDGDFDLYNANTSQPQDNVFAINRLYMNNGGTFEDWSSKGGLSNKPVGSRSVVALDINCDGYMDIYSVGSILPDYEPENNQLYINQGNKTFKLSDMGLANVNYKGFGPNGVTAADVNDDGYPEIYISRVDRQMGGARGANQFFFRQSNGQYVDKVHDTKTPGSGWSDGATFADYDNDGDLDLFVSSSNDEKLNKLFVYRNDGNGAFMDVTNLINIYQRAFSNVLFDVDNDGDLDLYAISDSTAIQNNRLYLNDGHGNFAMQSATGLEVPYLDSRGVGVADFDNDGDVDLFVTDANKSYRTYYFNHLFRNDTPNTGNKWLKIYGRGPKGDAGAYGTKIWIYDKGGMDKPEQLIHHREIISNFGFCASNDPVQHIGVGKRDTVAVKIRMTDGTLLRYNKVATNRKITFAKPGNLAKASGDNQSAMRNTTLPLPLKVTVTDLSNKPVMGAEIWFEAKDGQVLGTQPQYTDLNGQAQVQYVVGSSAPVQKVNVSCPYLANVYAEFTVNMLIIPKELQLTSAATLAGTAGEMLSDSIKVRVLDDAGVGKPAQAVQFSIVNGSGRLYPGGLLSAQVQTNSSGYAGVAWKLGKAPEAFTQQLSIQSLYQGVQLIGSPVGVSASVQYPDTLALEKVEGDGQSGTANTVLAQWLRVKVSSTTGVAPPPLAVRFRVTSGGGHVSEADSVTVTTDAGGMASVPWRLGANFQLAQNVLAYLVINPIHRVSFSATAQPQPTRLVYTGQAEFSGSVGRVLADPVKVKITDDTGYPVQNYTVLFKVLQGGGKINALDSCSVKTDGNGEASGQWLLGAKAGKKNNQLRIEAKGLAGSPVDIYASAQAGRAYDLKLVDGDTQSAGPRRVLQPMRIQVVDSLQNPVNRHPVRFVVLQGDAKIGTGTSFSAETDSSGMAAAVVTLNMTPGPVQVQAIAEYNGTAINGSPIPFHATLTPPVPKRMVYTGSLELNGQVGKSPAVLPVQVLDDIAVPVSGFSVLFAVTQGGGKVNDADSVRIITDAQGISRAVWTLGPNVGRHNNKLAIVGSGLQGSPVLLTASAAAGRAYRVEKTAGDGQIGTPRVLLSQPLTVTVTDSLNNPIGGHSVVFQVMQGDANFSGSSQIAMLTDTLGVARALLKLGTQIGGVQVRVSAQLNGRDLQNSPLLFTATVRPPNPTQLKLIGPAEYFGQIGRVLSQSVIAQVIDEFGYPVSGYTVTARVMSGGGKVNGQDSVRITTDDLGNSPCQWRLGPLAGTRNNQIVFVAAGLKGSPVLVTATGLAAKAFRMRKAGGDIQSGQVLTALAQPLQVLITDSLQYPVTDQAVTFQIMQGDAHFAGAASITVRSDSNGIAKTPVQLGTIPGLIQINASSNWNGRVLQGAPLTFAAQLVLPSIDRGLSTVSADSLVVADGQARAKLQAKLLDSQDKPLAGLYVNFNATGQANTITQPLVPTDEHGIAEGYLASTKAEVKKVWAFILYGSTILDSVRVRFAAGAAASLQKNGGDEQTGPVRLQLAKPLEVLLSDAFGNPVTDVLTLQETWPDGSNHTLASQTTNQKGAAQWRWTMGSMAGRYLLHVTHKQLQLTFAATANSRVPGQIVLVSGNDQVGRAGGLLAQPLTAKVLDTEGDPQAGVPLAFTVVAGGGSLTPATGAVIDSLGIGRVAWRVGSSGEQKVQASIIGLEGQMVEFKATLKANAIPTLRCPADTTINEGQLLTFTVQGSDADGDSLRFGVDTLPEGAVFNSSQLRFTWTPGFRHAGITKIAFWVQDSFGARAIAISSITVRDVPQAPTIVTHAPEDTLLNLAREDARFSVTAADEDGNYLYYSWWLNGNMVAPSGSEFLLRYRASLPLHSRLVVRVSDGLYTIEQGWQLNFASSVADDAGLPTEFALLQNYPNPFNPVTRIPFTLAKAGAVSILIYDRTGQLVRTLTDGYYPAGRYDMEWNARADDGSSVASGLYMCVLESEGFKQMRKIVLMK